MATGETYDPENPMCKGTAPICGDWFITTTTPAPSTEPKTSPAPTTQKPEPTTTSERTPNDCTEYMEEFPYPGNCHKYYVCVPTDTEDVFDLIVSQHNIITNIKLDILN